MIPVQKLQHHAKKKENANVYRLIKKALIQMKDVHLFNHNKEHPAKEGIVFKETETDQLEQDHIMVDPTGDQAVTIEDLCCPIAK
jgi:hypothetical protein